MNLAKVVLLVAALLWGAAAEARGPLRVMSFNIRYPSPDDGANRWPLRRALVVRTIAEADPDVIGMQEMFREQGRDIVDALPAYSWVGTGRGGGRDDEHMGLFWRRDRLTLIRWGEFWLSDTPEVAGSISWGNLYQRMVTWGEFSRPSDGRRFIVFNTHFPYRAEDGAARAKAARLLADRIAQQSEGLPVVLTGDFNDVPDSSTYRILTTGLSDGWRAAARRSGPDGTFNGFSGAGDRRIDWVLTRGFRVGEVRTIARREGAVFPSDHWPVLADLSFQN